MAKIGQHMATRKPESAPRLAVVCLPRVDYAALFTAYGALWSLASEDVSNSDSAERRNLETLRDKKVSCLRTGRIEATVCLGLLESIDYDDGIATILTKHDAPVDRSTDRLAVRHTCSINRRDWYSIRGADVTFDLARGATDRQRQRAGDAYREYHEIEKVMGVGLASAAMRTLSSYVAIVGEKIRFIEEMELLHFNKNDSTVSAGILLNPETVGDKNFRASGRYIKLLASGRDVSEADAPLVIIEAGRRLGDQLQAMGQHQHAIILVAANKRAHGDVIDIIAPFINTRGLYLPMPDLGDIPRYIKAIFIQ